MTDVKGVKSFSEIMDGRDFSLSGAANYLNTSEEATIETNINSKTKTFSLMKQEPLDDDSIRFSLDGSLDIMMADISSNKKNGTQEQSMGNGEQRCELGSSNRDENNCEEVDIDQQRENDNANKKLNEKEKLELSDNIKNLNNQYARAEKLLKSVEQVSSVVDKMKSVTGDDTTQQKESSLKLSPTLDAALELEEEEMAMTTTPSITQSTSSSSAQSVIPQNLISVTVSVAQAVLDRGGNQEEAQAAIASMLSHEYQDAGDGTVKPIKGVGIIASDASFAILMMGGSMASATTAADAISKCFLKKVLGREKKMRNYSKKRSSDYRGSSNRSIVSFSSDGSSTAFSSAGYSQQSSSVASRSVFRKRRDNCDNLGPFRAFKLTPSDEEDIASLLRSTDELVKEGTNNLKDQLMATKTGKILAQYVQQVREDLTPDEKTAQQIEAGFAEAGNKVLNAIDALSYFLTGYEEGKENKEENDLNEKFAEMDEKNSETENINMDNNVSNMVEDINNVLEYIEQSKNTKRLTDSSNDDDSSDQPSTDTSTADNGTADAPTTRKISVEKTSTFASVFGIFKGKANAVDTIDTADDENEVSPRSTEFLTPPPPTWDKTDPTQDYIMSTRSIEEPRPPVPNNNETKRDPTRYLNEDGSFSLSFGEERSLCAPDADDKYHSTTSTGDGSIIYTEGELQRDDGNSSNDNNNANAKDNEAIEKLPHLIADGEIADETEEPTARNNDRYDDEYDEVVEEFTNDRFFVFMNRMCMSMQRSCSAYDADNIERTRTFSYDEDVETMVARVNRAYGKDFELEERRDELVPDEVESGRDKTALPMVDDARDILEDGDNKQDPSDQNETTEAKNVTSEEITKNETLDTVLS